jgi:acetoacetate decarboxylase
MVHAYRSFFVHILSDLTLGLGTVVYDYLYKQRKPS